MARIRSVKPEFWQDEELATAVSRDARLLYIALWNLADEHGRLRGDARFVKGQVFMYEDDLTPGDVDKMLDALADVGKVIRYQVGSASYLFLPNLARHQRLDSDKVPSRLPVPPDVDSSGNFPDESQPGTDSSSLSYVAGSREHVAGAARGKFSDEQRTTVRDATGATDDEADAVIARVKADRKPRNLGAFLRTLADDGDLVPFLTAVRAERQKAEIAAALDRARASPACEHGQPGGDQIHPASGEPICAQCRFTARHAAA